MPSLKTSWWYSGGCVGVALGVALAWACASPPPDNTPDPCAVLTAECPYCTDPTAKETCENAIATADDVQCTVALDDTDVIATCVVPDGGSDAPFVSTTDAPPLPACDAAQVLPDAGCTCTPPCATTCPGGGCEIDCPPDAACLGSCNRGRVRLQVRGRRDVHRLLRRRRLLLPVPERLRVQRHLRDGPRVCRSLSAQKRHSRRTCARKAGRKTPSTRTE